MNGEETNYKVLVDTVTDATLPDPITSEFYQSSFTVQWPLANPADTTYELKVGLGESEAGDIVTLPIVGTSVQITENIVANTTYTLVLTPLNRVDRRGPSFIQTKMTRPAPVVSASITMFTTTATATIDDNGNNADDTVYELVATDLNTGDQFQTQGLASAVLELTGLTPNSTYQFDIKTVGHAGTISVPYEFEGEYVTKPEKPRNGEFVDVGVNYIEVGWNSNGNPDQTTYGVRVEELPTRDVSFTQETEETQIRFDFLEPNTSYEVSVWAIGHQNETSEVEVVGSTETDNSEDFVGSFGEVTVAPEAHPENQSQLMITWDFVVPEPPNPAPDQYLVFRKVGEGLVQISPSLSNDTSFFLDEGTSLPLDFNTSYDYVIGAERDGIITYSGVASSATLAAPALAVASPFKSTENSIVVVWEDSVNPNNPTYRVEISADEFSTEADFKEVDITSAPFGNLSLNTTYFTRVYSINLHDQLTGPVNLEEQVTQAAVPLAVEDPIVAITSYSVVVQWDANNNPDGTEFVIETQLEGAAGPSGQNESLTQGRVEGLAPNRDYDIFVRAINHAGDRTDPLPLGTIRTEPGETLVAPSDLVVEGPEDMSPGVLEVTFLDNSESSPTTLEEQSFDIYAWKEGESPVVVKSTEGSVGSGKQITAVVDGLDPNTVYQVYVVAKQGFGSSVPSEERLGKTWAEIPVWVEIPIVRGDKLFTLSWEQGNNPDGTRYLVQASSDGFNEWISSSDTLHLTATLDDLLGNQNYEIRVRAQESLYGEILSTNTLASQPGLPLTEDPFVSSENSIVVNWSSNENVNDTEYLLEGYLDEGLTQKVENTLLTQNRSGSLTGLAGNTTYWFTVKALSRDNVESVVRELGSAMTLPAQVSIAPENPLEDKWYGRDGEEKKKQFTFITTDLPLNAAYVRYRWWIQEEAGWPSDQLQDLVSTRWDGSEGPLVVESTHTGEFYFHARMYNAVGASNPDHDLRIGPFKVDVDSPTATLDGETFVHVFDFLDGGVIKSTNPPTKVEWVVTEVVDPLGAEFDPNEVYLWTFSLEPTEESTVLNRYVRDDLEANQVYQVSVRARDQADPPNFTYVASTETVTNQNIPDGVTILTVTQESAQVQVEGNFPRLDERDGALQVKFFDLLTGTTIHSSTQTERIFDVAGLERNREYEIRARAFNQNFEPTEWSVAETTTTLGSAPEIAYNPKPFPPEIYPSSTTVHFQDASGAMARGEISLFRMIVNESTDRPSDFDFDPANPNKQYIDIAEPEWSHLFVGSQESYVHIRSYDREGRSSSDDYALLGPWIIDARPPVVGITSFTVHGVSSITFHAQHEGDRDSAGFSGEIYSFDGGATFGPDNFLLLENLEPNTTYAAQIVLQDKVENKTTPAIQLEAATHQLAPEGIRIRQRNDDQIIVEALGLFPQFRQRGFRSSFRDHK